MRQIKFRAWDKINKEMINDIWIAPEYGWEVFSDNDAMCERERPKQGQIELMQCTGLKDKNDVDIYEGDLINNKYYIQGRICQIVWLSPAGCWDAVVYHYGNNRDGFKVTDWRECVEIIGNIYEGVK